MRSGKPSPPYFSLAAVDEKCYQTLLVHVWAAVWARQPARRGKRTASPITMSAGHFAQLSQQHQRLLINKAERDHHESDARNIARAT